MLFLCSGLVLFMVVVLLSSVLFVFCSCCSCGLVLQVWSSVLLAEVGVAFGLLWLCFVGACCCLLPLRAYVLLCCWGGGVDDLACGCR